MTRKTNTASAREIAEKELKEWAIKKIAANDRLPKHKAELDVPQDSPEELKWLLRKTGFILREEESQ